jgi:hypothetical protein
MLRDVYSAFLLAFYFLRKNPSFLIPFYIYYFLSKYSNWGDYTVGVLFVLLLFLHAFVVVAFHQKNIEEVVSIFRWQIVIKALWGTMLVFLFNFVALIIGSLLLGLIGLFAPKYVIDILLFLLVVNIVFSFLFGNLAMSFSKNITPVEAIILGLRSFYSNFLFYIILILTGVIILLISLGLQILINIKFIDLLINPALSALQSISIAFAFWRKTDFKDKMNPA